MSDQKSLDFSITGCELESHLWEATNIFSGSPVDLSDWKYYILPLPETTAEFKAGLVHLSEAEDKLRWLLEASDRLEKSMN